MKKHIAVTIEGEGKLGGYLASQLVTLARNEGANVNLHNDGGAEFRYAPNDRGGLDGATVDITLSRVVIAPQDGK